MHVLYSVQVSYLDLYLYHKEVNMEEESQEAIKNDYELLMKAKVIVSSRDEKVEYLAEVLADMRQRVITMTREELKETDKKIYDMNLDNIKDFDRDIRNLKELLGSAILPGTKIVLQSLCESLQKKKENLIVKINPYPFGYN